MIRRVADVAGGYEPVASKLLLGAEVPLVNLHVRAVIVDRRHNRIKPERRSVANGPSVWRRKWVATRKVRPGIFKVDIGQLIAGQEWRFRTEVNLIVRVWKIVEGSTGDPDRCAAVAFRIPRQSQPRRKIPPLIVPAGFAGESRIAIEEHAGRGVVKAGALDALVQGVHIEMSAASIQIDQREEWLPTQ